MASAVEQFASNLNMGAFAKAEELKQRLWFTLLALIVAVGLAFGLHYLDRRSNV